MAQTIDIVGSDEVYGKNNHVELSVSDDDKLYAPHCEIDMVSENAMATVVVRMMSLRSEYNSVITLPWRWFNGYVLWEEVLGLQLHIFEEVAAVLEHLDPMEVDRSPLKVCHSLQI